MAKKILKTAVNVGTFGLAGLVAPKIFGKKKKSTPAPVAEPTEPVMPLADDEAVARARKEALLRRRGAGGRSSTILTDGDTLGGGY